jgi:hypothetical protein
MAKRTLEAYDEWLQTLIALEHGDIAFSSLRLFSAGRPVSL